VAERVGFEPTVPVKGRRFSSLTPRLVAILDAKNRRDS
jgi:hypothetical protein